MSSARLTSESFLPRYAPEIPGLSAAQWQLLDDMIEGYANRCLSAGHRTGTTRRALSNIKDFLVHAAGMPGQVTPADFDRWSAHLRLERALKLPSVRQYQGNVRLFFDYLLQRSDFRNRVRQVLGADIEQVSVPDNSVPHRIERELTRGNPRRPFLEGELECFFTQLDADISRAWLKRSKSLLTLQRNKALFGSVLGLGLRADEALGLNLTSLGPFPDLDPRFRVFGAFGMAHVFGKGSKHRPVLFTHEELAQVLQWYVEQVRPQLARNGAPDEPALFLSERGGRLSYNALYHQYSQARERAGLPPELVPHCLRHTSMTHNDLAGMPLDTNRERHGHVYASTSQCYIHHPPRHHIEHTTRIIDLNLGNL